MTADDVVATSEIHARELPHGFFAELGPRFLAAYHRTFVDSPHAVALVAVLDDRVAGFLVGTVRTRDHYRDAVRRHGAELALCAALGLLRHPRALLHLVRHRLRRYARSLLRYAAPSGVSARSDGGDVRGPVAVLTHVAVLPGADGHGLGADLVAHFVAAVRDAGVREVRLVTLAGGDGAAGFYERLGFQRLRQRRSADGHDVVEFRRTP
ncbi:MAG: GNAT family N-acetyltransferase [Actinobacteria bacterium]|nr:GNAT family N-acetyltransferase [Actinomycetota bacterium]